MTDCNVVGFIFARGGSKGVPRKNLRSLTGKPLIAYSIEIARSSHLIQEVYVSTDCEEIAAVSRTHGAEVPFLRPPELATDSASEWLAWRHAIGEVERLRNQRIDVFVSIPTTAPLRSVGDVDASIESLLSSDADMVITVSESNRSPYFNMVVLDETHNARLVIPPSGNIIRRQDAPKTYDMTTVAYAARRDFIFAADSIFAGKVKAVVVPHQRALDIDSELDLQIAEYLACQPATQSHSPAQRKAG